MQYARSISLSSIALLAACEAQPGAPAKVSDAAIACVDPAVRETPSGPFATPEELANEACQPGALADFDPSGTWYYEQENRGIFSGSGPVHFDLSCQSGLGVDLGGTLERIAIDDSSLNEDYLFWRRERVFDDFDLTIVEAYLICGVTSLGTYIGQEVRCRITDEEGEQCETTGLSMKPFDRLAGEGESEGLELVSEYAGQAWSWRGYFVANVRVHRGMAYVSLDEGGLRIVDVSDPSAPVEVGVLESQDEERFNDVKIVSDVEGATFALMASNSRGMVVVDVSDPTSPRDIIAVTPSGEPNEGIHTLFTESIGSKTMAYLADGYSNAVTIWDVSNPRVPFKVGTHVSSDENWAVHDLYADQGRLYLNATVGGMIVVDTQPNPATPIERGTYVPARVSYSHSNWVTQVGDRKISVHGDEGYDAHFKIIDVDPESSEYLQEIGSYQTRPQVSAHNVMAIGNKAYAAYYQDGVRILDLSDPSNPTQAAYFNTWKAAGAEGGRFEGAVGIDVDADTGLIYVADQPRGLLILREN